MVAVLTACKELVREVDVASSCLSTEYNDSFTGSLLYQPNQHIYETCFCNLA